MYEDKWKKSLFSLCLLGLITVQFIIVRDVQANSAPTVTDVWYSGAMTPGATLSGSYRYFDADGDPDASTFQWYTGTDSSCSGKTPIAGANNRTYITQFGDAGKYICVGVTPASTSGTSPGTEVIWAPDVAIVPDAPPTVSEVSISGTLAVGQMLTGNYLYHDAEGNPEGTSIFRWYTGTDASCRGKTPIVGAESKTYTLTAAERGKFICFGVTPVATIGVSPGTEVIGTTRSAVDTPIYTSSPVPGALLEMTDAKPTTTLTVSNTGSATLNITGITFSGADAGKFSVSQYVFPVSIAAGGNQAFNITINGSDGSDSMDVAHKDTCSPAN